MKKRKTCNDCVTSNRERIIAFETKYCLLELHPNKENDLNKCLMCTIFVKKHINCDILLGKKRNTLTNIYDCIKIINDIYRQQFRINKLKWTSQLCDSKSPSDRVDNNDSHIRYCITPEYKGEYVEPLRLKRIIQEYGLKSGLLDEKEIRKYRQIITDFVTFSEIVINDQKKCIIVLDVDENIICYKNIILKNYRIYEKFVDILYRNKVEEFAKNLLSKSENRIMDMTFLNFFDKYKEYCIALTARGGNEMGITINGTTTLSDNLKQLGIEFYPVFTEQKSFDIKLENNDNFVSTKFNYKIKSPSYTNGIIFTCNSDKGNTLKEFLKIINYIPSMIYAFDDSRPNLESIYLFCVEANIGFVGYHNTYSKKTATPISENMLELLNQKEHTLEEIDELIDYFYKLS